jgi:hypothetical protein
LALKRTLKTLDLGFALFDVRVTLPRPSGQGPEVSKIEFIALCVRNTGVLAEPLFANEKYPPLDKEKKT